MQQFAFDLGRDDHDRGKRPERLFFAILPRPADAAPLVAFQRALLVRHDARAKGIRPERLHISLHHIRDEARLKPKYVHAATLAARSVLMQPFEVTARSVVGFDPLRKRDDQEAQQPVVLQVEGGDALADLHRQLGTAMRGQGLRPAAHFVPHMTLYYSDHPLAPEAIAPIRLAVDSFTLIHSRLRVLEYRVLKRFPLREGPPTP